MKYELCDAVPDSCDKLLALTMRYTLARGCTKDDTWPICCEYSPATTPLTLNVPVWWVSYLQMRLVYIYMCVCVCSHFEVNSSFPHGYTWRVPFSRSQGVTNLAVDDWTGTNSFMCVRDAGGLVDPRLPRRQGREGQPIVATLRRFEGHTCRLDR